MKPLYPLMLEASLHQKVWGGRRLATDMAKPLPDDAPYGESWELHDTSIVSNGHLGGKTLSEIIELYGKDLLGEQNDPSEGMPLLAKLLDASQWLSVQVHPDDEQAERLEGDPRGKTEAWIILNANDDSQLVIGVKPGTSRETMAQAIRDNQLEDLLVYQSVEPGDVLYIPANTIHAIGPGILLYEIQQSSNVTYRLYDWGRMGLDGKPRDLHIDKGVDVSRIDSLPEVTHPAAETTTMVDGDYFQTDRYTLRGSSVEIETSGKFHALTCIEGTFTVTHGETTISLQKGHTVLIPAMLGMYYVVGSGTFFNAYQK